AQVKGQAQNVMDAGNCSERHGGVNAPSFAQPRPVIGGDLVNQGQRHAQDLHGGVGFPEPGGPEGFYGAGGVEQRTHDQDDDVAAEDHDGDGPANDVRDGEHQKHGAQQELVSNGIKVLAERGFLLQQARQQAVQEVSNSGDNKDGQRPCVFLLLNGDHHKGNEDQPQQRQQVWRRLQL